MSTKRRALLESVNGIEDKRQRLDALSELQELHLQKLEAKLEAKELLQKLEAKEELWKQNVKSMEQAAKAEQTAAKAEKTLRRSRESAVAALTVELAKHKATFVINTLDRARPAQLAARKGHRAGQPLHDQSFGKVPF